MTKESVQNKKRIRERCKMIEHILENNEVLIIGKAISELTYSHKVYGEGFYSFNLEVPRLSDSADVLPVTVSERLLAPLGNIQGKILDITGQFRSYNQYEEGKNRLILTIFALEVKEASEEEMKKNKNTIYLNGFVCKEPVYRLFHILQNFVHSDFLFISHRLRCL